jgi:hypothetical protein
MSIDFKINRFFDTIRFWINWGMFTQLNDYFVDIKITAKTKNGKEDIWYLRRDEKIGEINIHSNNSRVTLSFRYLQEGQYFFNDYLVESFKNFYLKQGDIFLNLKIERVWYSSFENKDVTESRSKPIYQSGWEPKIIFEWNGVYNVNTGYL